MRGKKNPSFQWSGKMGRYRVYRYENHYWYADYRENGKRKRESLGVRKKPDAERAVRIFDEQRAGPASEELNVTVAELREQYLSHCKGKGLAQSTVSRYGGATSAFLRYCEREQATLARQLTLPLLEGFRAYRMEDESCAGKTAYEDSVTVKMMLKFAAHPGRHLMQENPALGWELRKPVREEPFSYTYEQVEKLMSGCREWLRPIVTTLAFSGLRIGELLHLRPEDVDLEAKKIHVSARPGWCPKGRRNRTVEMHPLVREAVKFRLDGQYVFKGPRGGRLKQNYLLEVFKKDRWKLGIPEGGLHTFRHFFISLAVDGKTNPKTLMDWVGHTSGDMLVRYAHRVAGASEDAMKRLAANQMAEKGHNDRGSDTAPDAPLSATG